MIGKQVYANDKAISFETESGKLLAAYIPNNPLDDDLMDNLNALPFTRVIYISRFGKRNRTPRLTWAYGEVKGFEGATVSYRGLDFKPEPMPPWLAKLAKYCCDVSKEKFGFDPQYNSVIIGKYEDGDDSIAFHTDDETFLKHHFCANVTIGAEREFQFKTVSGGVSTTHEIKLGHKSLFFFLGLEHALPKRAGVKKGSVRYSISFRNMKNNVGIGNSFYYCRGLAGAVDNEAKAKYVEQLNSI